MFVPHVCYGHTRVTRVQTSRDPTADCRLNWPLIRYLKCTAGSKAVTTRAYPAAGNSYKITALWVVAHGRFNWIILSIIIDGSR